MTGPWTKFRLLMWKNWVLQKRHPVQTLVEILAPVVFSVMLVLVRSLSDPETYPDPTFYQPFSPGNTSGTVLELLANSSVGGLIAYSPSNSLTQSIMKKTAERLDMQLIAAPNESTLIQGLTQTVGAMKLVLAGIVFDDNLSNETIFPDIKVKIRFPGEIRSTFSLTSNSPANWLTNLLFPTYQTNGPRSDTSDVGGNTPGYFPEGFLALQHALSSSLTEVLADTETIPEVLLQRFPYPPYLYDSLLVALQNMVSFIILLSLTYTSISIVKVITSEKELQLKETMKIMGLPNWLHWTAWFVNNFLMLLISVILMVVMLKVPWYSGTDVTVFTHSNWLLIFIFLMLYAVAMICFCFMITSFFSKANSASTVAGLAWFVLFAPYLFIQNNYTELTLSTKLATSLFSNTAMGYGFQLILMHEGTGKGIQWDNVWEPATQDDDLYFGHLIIFMLLDSAIYLLIAIYVEAVFPGAYGVPKPWYFLFQKSFWCESQVARKKMGKEDTDFSEKRKEHNFEQEPELPIGVQIRNLHKVYNNKTAVNRLNLNMYQGQITVLLGHNGAGKTTTMSMLTGMITPTSGTASVGGYDIRTEMNNARGSLGLCPQHNILFNEMTVREHIYFFGKLKGMDNKGIEDEIKRYLHILELEPKENSQSHTLSGGMKRKLSAAVALCGNSQVVMFDEPTSGMDPAARRTLWDLLRSEKQGRTIMLTTHFMDEADLLGDRIAIMAGGGLQCCGSSFFLKKRFGAGYKLIIVKDTACDVDKVTHTLRRHIPSLEVDQNIASELSYLLEAGMSTLFEPMLQELEEKKQSLNILSYGISLTTMEEVFIKVGKDLELITEDDDIDDSLPELEPEQKNNNSSLRSSTHTLVNVSKPQNLSGVKLVRNRLRAMWMKNYLRTLRSWVMYLIHILLPVCFLIIVMIVTKTIVVRDGLPALDLSLQSYNSPRTPVGLLTNDNASESIYHQYKGLVTTGLDDLNVGISPPSFPDMQQHTLDIAKAGFTTYTQRYIVGSTMDYDSDNSTPVITGWFNNQPYHGIPVALNLVHNAVLRSLSGQAYSLSIVNHPLPYTTDTLAKLQNSGANTGFQIAFNVVFSMSIVSAYYILFSIKDRVSKSKHLQFVSGVEVLTYWGTTYLWDYLTFVVIALAMVVTLVVFQEESFSTGVQIGRVLLVILCFGLAMLPLTYLLSFFFSIPASGYTRLVMVNVITGLATLIIVTTFKAPSLDLVDVGKSLEWVFLVLFPLFSLGTAISNLNSNYNLLKACEPFRNQCENQTENVCCSNTLQCPGGVCIEMVDNYLDWSSPGIGRNILFFLLGAVVYFGLLLLIEFRVFENILYRTRMIGSKRRKAPGASEEPDDSDVAEERAKIRMGNPDILRKTNDLLLSDVSKFYGNFRAVDQLCVGVKRGECFGLLGVNGAGKTSTFKMLTGDEKISGGEAYVNGLNLKTHMKQAHQIIGYCPQFDALIDNLTGRETLQMYCLLRGIPNSEIPQIINKLADDLLFTKHIDKKVMAYSGGNKRKLSTAVALVGDPPVVYLDEPTTGMDVVAKRHLWNVICQVRDSGKCIVLTSHSMEECEALCTRIAIMVNGRFKCLGSPQHLKSKFAEGYTLTIKVNNNSETDIQAVKEFVRTSLQDAMLREEREGLMTYYIANTTLTWSKMFGMMEEAKTRLSIEDYSLGQTSLEQVFLSFTQTQFGTD